MDEKTSDAVFESASELYREIRNRGLHLRHENGRDDILIEEICNSIGCPDYQLQEFLEEEGQSAEYFLREFLNLTAPFARMFSDIWNFLSSEGGPEATEDVRIEFGFEGEDITEVDLSEFREWAQTARKLWINSRMAYWSDEELSELFALGDLVVVEARVRGSDYIPHETYELPSIETHHEDEFEEIVRRIRNLFQNIIDTAAELNKGGYNRDANVSGSEVEESRSSILFAANLLHDLLPTWEQIFRNHHEVSPDARRQAVDFYKENIEPNLEIESNLLLDKWTPMDILRLPFWKDRWHTYEIWVTIQTLNALDSCEPQIRVVDGRIPIDGRQTEIVADLDIIGNPNACVVTELETSYPKEGKDAIRPDLSICRNQDLDANSRAVVIEYKQRASLSPSHVEEVTQFYLSGSPEAIGLAIVNYDFVPDVEIPESAELIGNVRPGSTKVKEYREVVRNFIKEAGLTRDLEEKAVLIDVSGSMMGEYADSEVEETLLKLLKWREKGLEVYKFNEGLTGDPHLTISEVETGLRPEGLTDVTRAVKEVCGDSGGPNTVLVVTDGEDPLPTSTPDGIETIKECSPQDLPDELDLISKDG